MEVFWDYNHGIDSKHWPISIEEIENGTGLTYNQQINYYKKLLKNSCGGDVSGIITSFIIWPVFNKNYLLNIKWDNNFYLAVVKDYIIAKDTGNQHMFISWPGWDNKWDQWLDRETNSHRIKLFDIKSYSPDVENELKTHRSVTIRKK